jgi:hypothetical protein
MRPTSTCRCCSGGRWKPRPTPGARSCSPSSATRPAGAARFSATRSRNGSVVAIPRIRVRVAPSPSGRASIPTGSSSARPIAFQRNLEFCGRLLAAAPDRAFRPASRTRAWRPGSMAVPPISRPAYAPYRGGVALAKSGPAVRSWSYWPRASAALKRPAKPCAGCKRRRSAQRTSRCCSTGSTSEAPGCGVSPGWRPRCGGERNEARRGAYLSALAGYESREAALVVMEVYGDLSPRLRATAQRLLCERSAWASRPAGTRSS